MRCLAFLLIYLCFHDIISFTIPPSVFRSNSRSSSLNLIIGLNKYSHDSGCCIIQSNTGKILFSQTKERYSRRKHDGGDSSLVIRQGLKSVGAKLKDVKLVVSNNHHFRVLPFEKQLPFACAIDYLPHSYMNIHNMLPNAKHLELSHHLAHVWSGIASAPFPQGLVVVMDGMGESYHAMLEDVNGIGTSCGEYMHDLKLLQQSKSNTQQMRIIPSDMHSTGSRYREAESAYWFDVSKDELRPVFKRWTRERAPPELYNAGFEHMESLGALYSRISSHILGDWNACGKVMGLSGWHVQSRVRAKEWLCLSKEEDGLALDGEGSKTNGLTELFAGNPIDEQDFKIHWETIESLPHANRFTLENFSFFASLANSVQHDLNTAALRLFSSLQRLTNAHNIVFVGGVALNSVLNGALLQSELFDQVHIPCAPGDEGIALGCALYGHHYLQQHQQATPPIPTPTPIQQQRLSAYQGSQYSDHHLVAALEEVRDWVTIEAVFDSDDELVADAAQALAQQQVVAWWQGRSELGQRALGSRSLLGNPSDARLRAFVNAKVKHREWFRPLAPSVLAEHVRDWFHCPNAAYSTSANNACNISPCMSVTLTVKEDKQTLVPAIVHIDGTARLQTVTSHDNALYHALLERFHALTKLPMLLNTSLNGKDTPIVESPLDALQFFMASAGGIDVLYLGQHKVRLKALPFPWLGSRHSFHDFLQPVQRNLSDGDGTVSLSEMKKLHIKVTSQCYLQERTACPNPSPSDAKKEKKSISTKQQTVRLRLQLASPFTNSDCEDDDGAHSTTSGGGGDSSNALHGNEETTGAEQWTEFTDVFVGEVLLLLQELASSTSSESDTVSVWALWRRLLLQRGLSPLRTWSVDEHSLWQKLHQALFHLHHQAYIALFE